MIDHRITPPLPALAPGDVLPLVVMGAAGVGTVGAETKDAVGETTGAGDAMPPTLVTELLAEGFYWQQRKIKNKE